MCGKQVIGVVVADSEPAVRRGAKAISVQYAFSLDTF
jgi:hypothetical protein